MDTLQGNPLRVWKLDGCAWTLQFGSMHGRRGEGRSEEGGKLVSYDGRFWLWISREDRRGKEKGRHKKLKSKQTPKIQQHERKKEGMFRYEFLVQYRMRGCVDAWMQGLKNVLLRITIHTSGAYIQTYTVHMAYYMSEKLATDTTYVL